MNKDASFLVSENKMLVGPAYWTLRPLDEWHEEDGNVLWWIVPICEPPFAGTPLDSDWTGEHTHWTKILVPICGMEVL